MDCEAVDTDRTATLIGKLRWDSTLGIPNGSRSGHGWQMFSLGNSRLDVAQYSARGHTVVTVPVKLTSESQLTVRLRPYLGIGLRLDLDNAGGHLAGK